MLRNITIAVNFIVLMASFWLGLYLITRSPLRPVAWISGLALWSTSAYFLNQLLALNPPPTPPEELRPLLYHLMLFWPRDVFELGWRGWSQGWLPFYGLAFWHHMTLHILPGSFNRPRQVKAISGYGIALAGILIKARYPYAWENQAGNPLYINILSGPLLLLFSAGFVLFVGLSVVNLAKTARAMPLVVTPSQFRLFACAALLGSLTGLLSIASSLLRIPLLQILSAIFLSAALLVAGAAATQYLAQLDHRPLKRDILFSAAGAGVALSAYLLFYLLINRSYFLPVASLLLFGFLAVVSSFLVDILRLHFERHLSQNKKRDLRLQLRQYYNPDVSKGDEAVEIALDSISSTVGASWIVALFLSPQGWNLLASRALKDYHLEKAFASLKNKDLWTNEPAVFGQIKFPPPLDHAALMLPVYEQDQTGVLLFGPSRHRMGYSEPEFEILQDIGYAMAAIIQDLPADRVDRSQVKEKDQIKDAAQPLEVEEISPRLVEQGLRNLHDYTYLADSPLTNLRLVQDCLQSQDGGSNTYIDRGKAVSTILAEAISILKPDEEEPAYPPPRNWHPYLILRDAYLEDDLNRTIMARLYISEGTFNRTRRAAIKSVTRILIEMETSFG